MSSLPWIAMAHGFLHLEPQPGQPWRADVFSVVGDAPGVAMQHTGTGRTLGTVGSYYPDAATAVDAVEQIIAGALDDSAPSIPTEEPTP